MNFLGKDFLYWAIFNLKLGHSPEYMINTLLAGREVGDSLSVIQNLSYKINKIKNSNEKIFVNIASYRDSYTAQTIKEVYSKAKNPEKINVNVVCQVNIKEDSEIISSLNELLSIYPTLRIDIVNYNESKGVCWARQRGYQSLTDEMFFLQIDSHTLLSGHWDYKLKEDYLHTSDPRSIFSSYPPGFLPPNHIHMNSVTVAKSIFEDNFTEDAIYQCTAEYQDWKNVLEIPIQNPYISAGFIFGDADFIREVGYDPHLFFFGEEFDLSVRAWTGGWSVYSTIDNYAWHLYHTDNADRKMFFNDFPEKTIEYKSKSIERLKFKLGLISGASEESLIDINKYSLGNKRTLQNFQKYANIDLINKKIINK